MGTTGKSGSSLPALNHESNEDTGSSVDSGNSKGLPAAGGDIRKETKQSLRTEATQFSNATGLAINELEKGQDANSEHVDERDHVDAPKHGEEHPFSKQTWKEDLKLVVEGRSLYVSKTVLGLLSPVFSELFEKGLPATLEIPDTTFSSMLEFLLCLYPHIRKPVTIDNIHLVIKLAFTYQVQTLISDCENVITLKAVATTPCDVLISLQMICQQMGLNALEKTCSQVLASKDVSELEKINYHDSQARVCGSICELKSNKYQQRITQLLSQHVSLEEERDEYYLRYMFLLDSCLSLDSVTSDTLTYRFTCIPYSTEIRLGTEKIRLGGVIGGVTERQKANSFVKSPCLALKVKLQTVVIVMEYTGLSTVTGRVSFKNFVHESNTRVFTFLKKLSNNDRFIEAGDLALSVISDPRNGFLLNGVGELVIQYVGVTIRLLI